MRRNWACQAVKGYGSLPSSMSRIARPKRVQVVLNAQQEQGIGPVAIDNTGLQLFEPVQLCDRITRIYGGGGQDHREAGQQPGSRRSCGRAAHAGDGEYVSHGQQLPGIYIN